MSGISTVFFDVGGVLLTNGWDRHCRRAVTERFDLDWEEFRDRHDFVAHGFEIGEISLDEYLDRTIFYRERSFSKPAIVTAMRGLSQELPGSLDVVRELKANGVFLATLNNESRELNEYRIGTFHLDDVFEVFLSSCYLGVKKPEARIYELAFNITQRAPDETVFVDDRPLNLECAADQGMPGIRFTSVDQLRHDLTGFGLL